MPAVYKIELKAAPSMARKSPRNELVLPENDPNGSERCLDGKK
jgi:hypothetical protein